MFETKPKQVEVTAIPILWELLKSPSQMQCDAELRRAIRDYAMALRDCFGERTLLDMSNGHISPSQKRSLEMLIR
ncbi:unnamed protein product [Anisakis simplex]|uniref:Protein FAM179A (inferred by orthology to a human protein) n=1 Tax=Anisakis simplex TaxID=6269 RepID=A0A0M3K824_ANISI|nr:unnamed protein product [Anisakis simplex]